MVNIVLESGYKGYIGIEYEGSEVDEIKGISLTKKLLEKKELDILRIRLPMSNPGIYLVKLFSESGVENHRIIKK